MTADKPLTGKQLRFVHEYLIDMNASAAAARAGYKAGPGLVVTGSRLLRKTNVQAAINARASQRIERLELDADEYLGILHDLCTFDPAKCLDSAGNWLPVSSWTPRERRALAMHETIIKNARAGDGVTDEVLKARFVDRRASVELMLRHMGLLVDRHEVGRPGEFDNLSREQIDAELEKLRVRQSSRKLLTEQNP